MLIIRIEINLWLSCKLLDKYANMSAVSWGYLYWMNTVIIRYINVLDINHLSYGDTYVLYSNSIISFNDNDVQTSGCK